MIDENVHQTEKHYGIVTRIEDEKKGLKLRGAVYFRSETLTGESEYPIPAEPSFTIAGANQEGWFHIPQIGDQIEVELNVNNEHTVPKYLRGIYSDEDEIADEFKENYGHRMGFKSRSGHLFLLDNKEDALLVKLMHSIGTGFEWDNDGNEIKTIIKDLKETIKGEVIREVVGQVSEVFKAEVKRVHDMKVDETYKKDLKMMVQGQLKIEAKKSAEIKSSGKVNIEAVGEAILKGTAGTKVGSGASVTEVDGSIVNLGGGGAPVARVGDSAIGIGVFGIPVVSSIISGSPKVTSG